MNDFRDDKIKFNYLFSLISAREDLKRVIDNRTISRDKFTILNLNDEIRIAYNLIFENRKPINLKEEFIIPDNLKIQYPLYIFRAIIYEYIKNANSHLYDISSDKTNKRPYIYVSVNRVDDKNICIIIKNNSICDFDNVKPFKEMLSTKGYTIKREKGLYKNSLLLNSTGCDAPCITFTEPDKDEVFDFCISLKIRQYES